MSETRLKCISSYAAAAVALEAHRPGDPDHYARQEGDVVVISYYDPRYPMDVAEWAHQNDHAHDDDAARAISNVQKNL